jgi:hypothetical protein
VLSVRRAIDWWSAMERALETIGAIANALTTLDHARIQYIQEQWTNRVQKNYILYTGTVSICYGFWHFEFETHDPLPTDASSYRRIVTCRSGRMVDFPFFLPSPALQISFFFTSAGLSIAMIPIVKYSTRKLALARRLKFRVPFCP